MARKNPTIRERVYYYPIYVASVGSAEECVLEERLEGAEMTQQQVIEEIGVRRENPAYGNGWEDGRFGPTQLFLESSNLARWMDPQERLSYYQGHRSGRRVREMLEHKDSA